MLINECIFECPWWCLVLFSADDQMDVYQTWCDERQSCHCESQEVIYWAGGVSESVFKCHALLSAGLLSVKWVYSERNSLVLYYISSVFQTVIQENNRIMMQTLIKYETSSDSGMKQLYRRWKSRYSDQLKFCSHLHYTILTRMIKNKILWWLRNLMAL